MSKLLALALVLLISVGTLAGSTIAWFTDSVTSTGNVIKSGTLDVAMDWMNGTEDPNATDAEWKDAETSGPIFNNDLWEPGYTEARHIRITNKGSLALEYTLHIVPTGEFSELAKVIDVYFSEPAEQLTSRELPEAAKVSTLDKLICKNTNIESSPNYTAKGNLKAGEDAVFTLALKMQESAGNEYQNKAIGSDFAVYLLAAQDTVESDSFDPNYDENATSDPEFWENEADISWYNATDTEFLIMTAEQLAGLAKLVDEGNNFAGKTIKLGADLNLFALNEETGEPYCFDPIGDKSPFAGTFDGQGHTIENLYQSGWAFGYEWGSYGSLGLFGELESATVKNLTIKGAETFVEGGDVSFVAGSATGTCVFENITIKDSIAATYNNGCGGIIGWSGTGNYTFKNITIEDDVVLAGLWGSFDSSIGGIVGQGEPGATYNFENVEINCRIDAYNDCTASYDYYNYRMCGMIIGRLEKTTTIDGRNYPDTSKYNITCNNVTVNYGDWMNYHYCEPTPGLNGGRGMRVEPGYAYDGLPADFDHSQCTTNHNALIAFDQIFGGAQLGVKGLKEYTGVTVNYPA